jgi:hypothetical protein
VICGADKAVVVSATTPRAGIMGVAAEAAECSAPGPMPVLSVCRAEREGGSAAERWPRFVMVVCNFCILTLILIVNASVFRLEICHESPHQLRRRFPCFGRIEGF